MVYCAQLSRDMHKICVSETNDVKFLYCGRFKLIYRYSPMYNIKAANMFLRKCTAS